MAVKKTADGSSKPEANMEVRDAENEPKESSSAERNRWVTYAIVREMSIEGRVNTISEH